MKEMHATILLILLAQVDRSFTTINFTTDDELYTGSKCTVKNEIGVCAEIYKCPAVLLQLIQGERPSKVCGFNGTIPIICCLKNQTKISDDDFEQLLDLTIRNDTQRSNNEEETTTDTSNKTLPVGKMSDLQCSRYELIECRKWSKRDTYERTVPTVVGGIRTLPREFKGAAAVGCRTSNNSTKWFCGGTLISENYVLTAAHCLFNKDCGPATMVRLGVINLLVYGEINVEENSSVNRPADYTIIERLRHPNYTTSSLYHDIALLRLDRTVKFNNYVGPTCLSYSRESNMIQQAVAIGWGKTDWADDVGSDYLLKVQIPLRPYENCSQFYVGDPQLEMGIVNNWQICAGDEGKDTCQGDSGGGLIINGTGCIQSVIGVTSFGKFCGSKIPAIYTRVSNYIEWIENIVWAEDFMLYAEK